MAVDHERVTRITRKIETVWLNVPDMSLMRMLRDILGDQRHYVTTDDQLESELDKILLTLS